MLLTLLQFFASKFLVLALHLEAGSFPRPLSPQEEIRTFAALRAGDSSAREKLIRHNLRLVAHIAKKYYALPSEQDDLISIGTIGLMKAVDTFDSTRRARFSTYASRCIENAILSPAHFGMEKRIHLFHAMTHLRQNRFFWSRESGSFFLLQRVSCEGCGLTPSIHLTGKFGRPPHHRRGAGVLPYVPLLRRHPEPMGPSALVPLQPWSAAERRCCHGGHGGMALSGSGKRHILPQLYAGTCGQARRSLRQV